MKVSYPLQASLSYLPPELPMTNLDGGTALGGGGGGVVGGSLFLGSSDYFSASKAVFDAESESGTIDWTSQSQPLSRPPLHSYSFTILPSPSPTKWMKANGMG